MEVSVSSKPGLNAISNTILDARAKLRERRRAKIYAAYEEASRDQAFMHDMNADVQAFDATLADLP